MAARSVVPVMNASWFSERHLRAHPLNVRTLPAAIRIPSRIDGQLLVFPTGTPRLFVHEGARQALERRFTAAHPGPVVLSITDNRHAMISHSQKQNVLRVRLHHMFLGSSPRILDALVRYVVKDDRDASQEIGRFIDLNSQMLARRSRRHIPLHTSGKHHDLLRILDEVNARYFGSTMRPLISWGTRTRPASGGKRKTIRLGSYSPVDRLVRVNPALDRAWVPRYFVAFIVYHELLHHYYPATLGGNRRALHPPEFLERERQFRNYERAIAWEKTHQARLLRA
jgi:hypothetical protein